MVVWPSAHYFNSGGNGAETGGSSGLANIGLKIPCLRDGDYNQIKTQVSGSRHSVSTKCSFHTAIIMLFAGYSCIRSEEEDWSGWSVSVHITLKQKVSADLMNSCHMMKIRFNV